MAPVYLKINYKRTDLIIIISVLIISINENHRGNHSQTYRKCNCEIYTGFAKVPDFIIQFMFKKSWAQLALHADKKTECQKESFSIDTAID